MAARRGLRARIAAALLGLAPAAAAPAAEWPLHLLPSGDIGLLLAVEAAFDGQRGLWLIDSGSSHNLVAASRVGAPPGAPRERVASAVGTLHGERVTLDALVVADGPPQALPALRLALEPVFGPLAPRLHGVLGRPFLDGRRWRFDLVTRRLLAGAPPAGAGAIALERVQGLPTLRLALPGGPPERYLFDTGAAGALVRLDRAAPPGVELHRIERLDFAGVARGQVPLATLGGTALARALDGAVAGSAGMALLAGCTFTLDLVDDRLAVERCLAPDLPGGFGLQLGLAGDAVVLARVWPGSPAADAGLRAGDRVLTLAAREPRSVPDGDALLVAAAETLALEVERGGERRALRLTRRYFLPLLTAR